MSRGNRKEPFNKPEGLSPDGERAYEIIIKHLKENTPGQEIVAELQVFWGPKDYDGQYGKDSCLIVMYDGLNTVGKFFSLDIDYPHYKNHEPMRQALETAGFYADECTGYYSAVYKRK